MIKRIKQYILYRQMLNYINYVGIDEVYRYQDKGLITSNQKNKILLNIKHVQ